MMKSRTAEYYQREKENIKERAQKRLLIKIKKGVNSYG